MWYGLLGQKKGKWCLTAHQRLFSYWISGYGGQAVSSINRVFAHKEKDGVPALSISTDITVGKRNGEVMWYIGDIMWFFVFSWLIFDDYN